VADKFTAAYFEDMERLNVMEADEYTYATKTLDGIQRLIAELAATGYAYPADGDVYYAVRKFDGYGKLSGRKLEDMQACRGARGVWRAVGHLQANQLQHQGRQFFDINRFAQVGLKSGIQGGVNAALVGVSRQGQSWQLPSLFWRQGTNAAQ
jgi:hypothetical protein